MCLAADTPKPYVHSTSVLPDGHSKTLPSLLHFRTVNAELLHHFSTVVSLTLGEEPAVQKMWQQQVMAEAETSAHLAHSIMAVSALHLDHIHRRTHAQYRVEAVRHQVLALAAFRVSLENIKHESCHALCASGSLLTYFAAGLPSSFGDANSFEGVNEVAELSRGVRLILQMSGDEVRCGMMGPMLNRISWSSDAPIVSIDVRDALQQLEANVNIASAEEDARAVCLSAVNSLRETFEAMAVNGDHTVIVLIWLVLVDREFLRYIKARQPLTLVVLAHYSVALHRSRRYWWSKDWGVRILSDVYVALDATWRPMISWPMEQVQTDTTALSG